MKVSMWIVITAVALAFVSGFGMGIQLRSLSPEIALSSSSSTSKVPTTKARPSADQQSKPATLKTTNSSPILPIAMDDIVAEIDNLLATIENNPKQRSLTIKLLAILEALSVDELLGLAPLLESKPEAQAQMLSQIIVGQLIEKAPEQALAFAQRYNPMPD